MTTDRLTLLFVALGLLCADHAWSRDGAFPAASGTAASDGARQRLAQTAQGTGGLRGEWYRSGPTFVCKVSPGRQLPEPVDPNILAHACQHMGPLKIGDPARNLPFEMGGPPHRTRTLQDGQQALLYFLEKHEQYPYLVVTVSKDRIVALQITGTAAAKKFSFNGVNLGDTTDALAQRFGPARQLGPSSLKDTDLWSYSPFAFSFEVKDRRVISIRISEK
jgi:hypothetical protein